MREQFEKLPEIEQGLRHCHYDESTNIYHADAAHVEEFEWHTQFVNGAWYSYQEQQKKIEQLLEIINTGLKIEHNMNNQIHSLKEKIDTAIEYLDSIKGLVWYEQIKDILK